MSEQEGPNEEGARFRRVLRVKRMDQAPLEPPPAPPRARLTMLAIIGVALMFVIACLTVVLN